MLLETAPMESGLNWRLLKMGKTFATYRKHHGDSPAGHIYLDKEGACTITLTGAASMPQEELDSYGEIMAEALNKSVCGSI